MFVGPTNSVFNFEKSHYRLPEDVNPYYTTAGVWVFRSGTNTEAVTLTYRINNFREDPFDPDEEDNNTFPLQPQSDYATPEPPDIRMHGTNADFVLAQGTLAWGANDFTAKRISFTIPNDQLTEFNEDFHIFLWRVVNNSPTAVGTINETCVTILFDDADPPAGSVDEFHNADFGVDMAPPVATTPPQLTNPGADGVVYSLASQSDGQTIIAGNFFAYNTIPRRCIARMGPDGMIDSSFDPGGGADDFISSVVLTPGGQIYVGGGFKSFNSSQRNGVARLTANGGVDPAFAPVSGVDAAVWSIVLQSDNKLLIAGEFTTYDGTNRLHIARVNPDGSLDATFNPGTNGPNGTIWSLALQSDGKIIIAGEFTSVGGLTRNGLARLNANGSVDLTFDPGTGANGVVYAVALRPDGKLWVGGEFSLMNSVPFRRFARLNANGTIDTSFDPGTGADSTVYSIAVQPTGEAYVGGTFSSFNGTHRLGFTRLYDDGTVDTTFLDTAYNQFAGLHRPRFSDPAGAVFASSVQPDGKVLIGGSFQQVGGGQAEIKVRTDAAYPTNSFNADVWTEKKARDGLRNRSNVARLLGGSTPGPGNIGLLYNSYPVGENQSFVFVGLLRTNGTLGYLSANFGVAAGLAQSGVDYVYNGAPPLFLTSWRAYLQGFLSSQPNAESRMHSDGLFGTNSTPRDLYGNYWFSYLPGQVTVSVMNDTVIQGDRSATFQLANPIGADQFFLGGANVPLGGALGRSKAPFIITDDDHKNGAIGFSSAIYSVTESPTNATITVTRTNGAFGSVTVQYQAQNGSAIAGTDYDSTSGSLSFGNGQTSKTFTVTIKDNGLVQPLDRTVNLRLFGPGGGATLGLSNAVLSIVDNDYPPGFINFISANFSTNESAPAIILTLSRSGGSRGTVSVDCRTTNGTALAGVNFVGVTNTVQWNDLDSSFRYITVPLIHDGLAGSNKNFQAILFNPRVNTTNAPTVLAGATSKTTANIIDDDHYGNLQFSAPSYTVNENGGYATITVFRAGGSAETLNVQFSTADGGAVSSGPLPNFVATNGTLTFNPGEISKSFNVTILGDGVTDPPLGSFFFTVNLSGLTPGGAVFGSPISVPVYILDSEGYNQPAGSPDTIFTPSPGMNGDIFSVAIQGDGQILAAGNFTQVNNFSRNRIVRLNTDASLDVTFLSGLAGANGVVQTMLLQANGRVLIGGNFTQVNNVNRTRLARLVSDGSIDTSFNPGSGADGPVFALAETFIGSTRLLLVGGSFTTINGSQRVGLARIAEDGGLDGSFDPALALNGAVYSIAVYPTNSVHPGKILIGGDFTQVNGTSRPHIARLNTDGTLDLTFDPASGPNDTVRALALQLDGRVLVGGSFTNFNGQAINRIARLNVNGSLDPAFNVGPGTDDTVLAIAVQPDNRIVLAGQFSRANGVSRGRITRLLPDGAIDPAINFGTGANSFINSLALQSDGMFLIGGGFTEYDGLPRQRIARIYGGSLTGSGALEFAAGNFEVDENATNAVITVRRRGGTSGDLSIDFGTSDGTAHAGVNYSNVNTSLVFPNGETLKTVTVPVRDDLQITEDLIANLTLSNGPLGNQPTATLTIINDDSSISFSAATYSRAENAIDNAATIHVIRQGSARGVTVVDFLTTTNGTAAANTNYLPVATTLTFQPGDTNLAVKVPLLHDPRAQGDRTVVMVLTNLSGGILFSPSVATLTILDVENAPGQLMFAQLTNVVSEAAGFLPVSVIRTNGRLGSVSVNFATLPGTAVPGLKYGPTNGILTFGNNETNKIFNVPILNGSQAEGNQTFSIILSNATGGATILPPTNSLAIILDDDAGVTFSAPVYVVPEAGSGTVSLTVLRQGGTNMVTTVSYATTNGSAVAGTNYVAQSGTLTFTNGEISKSFSLAVLDDPRVTGDLNFGVNLVNPSAPAQLIAPSSASVLVLDSDPGFAFTNANFSARKSGTNVLISVLRTNANTGIVSVNFATSNGTAQAGIDFVATNGVLTFSNGIALKTFPVTIISNRLALGDKAFTISLLNPSPGAQLIPPSVATVTITDDISGLSFSAPVYTINENGGSATITVLRSNYTNSIVAVDFSTANGSPDALENYTPVSGTLTFTNGELVKTFNVPVQDNGVVDGDKTVLLHLTNVVGNAVLLSPNENATLRILEIDGSLIAASGTALLSESGPVNGSIDPGETVSMLFGLRNTSGTNTASLVATLLATNGVASPTGPQNYGVLPVHGPSASRQFGFTASGTNGQTISAIFQLKDGTRDLGSVSFNFVLGTSKYSFTNATPIVIRDNTNALPYPSIISPTGLGGVVSKVTVVLTNLTHSAPYDIDALLVSPDGQKSLLMAKCGTNHAVNNVTLTFDDSGPALPQFSQISSGTNRPTSFAVAPPPFPVPAPPAPYSGNLAVFNGSNPNGSWSLYVLDDVFLDTGIISNGWVLNLTTTSPAGGAADVGVALNTPQGTVVATSNLTYSITVTNYGPSAATGIVISDILPAGTLFVSSVAGQGSVATNGAGLLTWNVGGLSKDGATSLSLTVRPLVAGLITNSISVLAGSSDPNPEDDSATLVTTVVAPSADIALGMIGASPVLLGNSLTYTLLVTNFGPGTAAGVAVTNTLPPGVAFISATPAAYQLAGAVVTFTNLGNLPSGSQTSATITVRPLSAGTITNNAASGSAILDPLKGNNAASVKTIVEGLQLAVSYSAGNITIAWPVNSGNYSLESATNLTPPSVWLPVTNPPPSVLNGQYRLNLPVGSGTQFFRLRAQIQ
jgi:uncharacterized delta-60 repeat protein/uncharacterized repeat protein (TIGR01451 family)